MMIDADAAQAMILRFCEGDTQSPHYMKHAIQCCVLSERGDYWIIRANSEAYVVHGRSEYCYVGVNAFLLDVVSGEIETVVSGNRVSHYLQDKYDIRNAAGQAYVLEPAFERSDKAAVVRLRQTLACRLPHALALLSPEHRSWLTGRRRVMQWAQRELVAKGVATEVMLRRGSGGALYIPEQIWHWDLLLAELKRLPGLG